MTMKPFFKDNIYTFAENTIIMANEIVKLLQEYDHPTLTAEERTVLTEHCNSLLASLLSLKRDIGSIGIEPLYILGIAAISAALGKYNDAIDCIKQAKTYNPLAAVAKPLNQLELEVTKRLIVFIEKDERS